MSLDYVSRGDTVKASTVNSLIDAVGGGGNQSPDLIITGTKNGPQFVSPSKMGSKMLAKPMLFDVDNYILSGWPMARIQLGFDISSCLEGIKLHSDNGTTTPISAVVVVKNTQNCPFSGGNLSSYVLNDNDFAKDADVGATGWVKTYIEGNNGQSLPIQLQLWQSNANAYQVFTNVSSDNEVSAYLRSALQTAGGSQSELSSLKKDYEWILSEQTTLGSGNDRRATCRISKKNGCIDIFQTTSAMKAMLKAKLICYKVEEVVEDEETKKKSHWAWAIPMGTDCLYDESNEVVYSSQLTYGGDPILVKATAGSLEDFDGQPMWLGDEQGSSYSDDISTIDGFLKMCILYDAYEVEVGDNVEADEVWLNLSYDNELNAVVAELANEPDEEATENDPLVSKNIFIATAASFKPTNPSSFDEANEKYMFYGTVGDMFKDGPKVDSTLEDIDGNANKSIEWKTKDTGESQTLDVGCNYLQLYNFDKNETTEQQLSDSILVRRYDESISSATLEYVPLSDFSSVMTPPDGELSTAQTSSLQYRVVTVTHTSSDPDTSSTTEVSSDVSVVQAWNFDVMSAYFPVLSDALSNEQHIMLRNASLSTINYLSLSCLSSHLDSDGSSGQKSISMLDQPDWQELQLYGMDEAGETTLTTTLENKHATDILPGTYEFVLRSGGAGGEITYANVALSLSIRGDGGDVSVDAAVDEAGTKSVQYRYIDELSGRVLELYNFHDVESFYPLLSAADAAGEQNVLLRNNTLSTLEYIALSAVGSVTLSGTPGTNSFKTSNEFQFKSAPDSGVRVTVTDNNEISIGVYYK